MYTAIGNYCSFLMTVCLSGNFQDSKQSSKKNNKYQLLYAYSVPPDDRL